MRHRMYSEVPQVRWAQAAQLKSNKAHVSSKSLGLMEKVIE